MRTRGLIVSLSALLGFLLLPAVAAQAVGPKLKLVPAVGPPTAPVQAKGSQYPPGHGEIVTFDGVQVATALTSAAGTFKATFTVPATALPGTHTVTAADANGLGASASFLARTDWSNARFDPEGSGLNPFENVLNPSNVGGLSQLVNAELGASLLSAPLYTGGTLVAGLDDGTVRALDPSTGGDLWSFQTGGRVAGSPLAVQCGKDPGPVNHVIVAGSGDGHVYGIGGASGLQVWSFDAGAPISTSPIDPTAVEDAFVAADDGSVYELNGCTGAMEWGDVAVGPGPTQTPAFLPGVKLPDGSTHDIIVVCFGDGSVQAIDGGTGGVLWSELVPAVQTPPAAYGKGSGARIVVASNGSVVELNGAGRRLWSTPMGGVVSGIGLSNVAAGMRRSSPALTFSPSEVIVTDLAGDVDALNPRTGAIDWTYKDPGPVGAPSIADGVVYVEKDPGPSQAGEVIGLNASTGDPLFHLDLGSLNPQPLPPFPAIADGMLFTGSFDTEMRVYALPG